MDIFTHAVVGALLYILFLKDVTFAYLPIAIFFAILPDLDIFLIPLRRIFKSKYLDHRGGSHSYVMGIMISAFLSIFYSIFRSKSFFITWLIGAVFYGLHISMDLLTTTKIPYLYPLSKKEHCFYVEKAGSFFTMVNSIFFLLLLGVMFNLSADLGLIQFVLNLYTAFFIIYYFYRIVSKLWFSSNLKDNQKYFPSISPFSFVIYDHKITENNILLKLEKKNHFLKPKEISNIDFTLNTEEMILFEKSMELLKKNYYYAKWTLFPIILRNDEVFTVRFYFLETMRRKSAFYIQYHFGVLTHQLIDFKRGSGPIQSQYG